ncbi:MAG: hypothetical protein ABEJ82_08850 [Haloplanus sp.]
MSRRRGFLPVDDHPETTRSLDAANAGRALLPRAVRRWAVTVSVTTDRDAYAAGDPVRFRVRFRNRLPVPLSIRTATPVPWTWSIDGLGRASRVPGDSLPETPGTLRLARRETTTVARTWFQRIRVADDEWVAADPGDHTLRVSVPGTDLAAETTVRIER